MKLDKAGENTTPNQEMKPIVSLFSKADPTYQRLVPIFVGRLATHVLNMRAYLVAGDWHGVRNLAHQLKGAGGGYGFPIITEIAGEIELLADAPSPPQNKLKEAIQRFADTTDRITLGLDIW